MGDLVLVAAFVNSASVAELRVALGLPVNLGRLEPEFVRSAELVFACLGKTVVASIQNFTVPWAERFDQDLRACRRVIDAALAEQRQGGVV